MTRIKPPSLQVPGLGRAPVRRHGRIPGAVLALCLAAAPGCASQPQVTPGADAASVGRGVARLGREADGVRPLVRTRWAAELIAAVPSLPTVPPRRIYRSADGSRFYGELEAQALSPSARAALVPETVDETAYYYGDGASPLFYARLLDLVAEGTVAGMPGRRFLIWRSESIAALRLLAIGGAATIGMNPSPRLRAAYSQPGDQGAVPLVGREVSGQVTLVPSDFQAGGSVGQPVDAIFVRNVLKRGYVHPAEPLPPGQATNQLALGGSDEEFVRSLYNALKPGGRLILYNLCPPLRPGQPYDPDSDCRNPIARELWQAAGFRVRDYDRSDTPAAREFGKALGFGEGAGAVNLDELSATYSLLERL
ncbi:MAG: hypothetical protein U1A78_07405 [Polyangia bacterium]